MSSTDGILVQATTVTSNKYRESSKCSYMQDAASLLTEAAMSAHDRTRIHRLGGSLRDIASELFKVHDFTCVPVEDPAVAPICFAIVAPCMFQGEVDNVTCKRW